MLLWIT